jgi:beta-1,4-N-acetylglucosaminyltransferase
LIFIAVGTQFGFDRLVRAVDQLIGSGAIQEEVFAQMGPGSYLPQHMRYVQSLPKAEFDQAVQSCSALISHAGIGNISLALSKGKPLLVMPRLPRYGEVVNNHQVDTAKKFEELGHILVAYDETQLPDKIRLLKSFVPKPRVPNRQGVIDRISQFLQSIESKSKE